VTNGSCDNKGVKTPMRIDFDPPVWCRETRRLFYDRHE
jgi:hypothetical protein